MFEALTLWIEDTFEIYLVVSFIFGILGILILSYRADSYKYENGKKRKSSTFKESSISTLAVAKQLYTESLLEFVGVCILLLLFGSLTLVIALLPRVLIKRWLS